MSLFIEIQIQIVKISIKIDYEDHKFFLHFFLMKNSSGHTPFTLNRRLKSFLSGAKIIKARVFVKSPLYSSFDSPNRRKNHFFEICVESCETARRAPQGADLQGECFAPFQVQLQGGSQLSGQNKIITQLSQRVHDLSQNPLWHEMQKTTIEVQHFKEKINPVMKDIEIRRS